MELTRSEIQRLWTGGHGLRGDAAAAGDGDGLSSAGWLHAIGGADVYVSGLARTRGGGRDVLDRAIEDGRLRVVPGARGCTLLVPHEDVPAALGLANHLESKKRVRDRAKLGVEDQELADLGAAVTSVLKGEPATTQALRTRLPSSAIRSLGDAGKKLGVSSTLPMALRQLESEGLIGRKPAGGRLDTEQVQWCLEPVRLPVLAEPEAIVTEVARGYFLHAGPATLKDFAAWSGLAQRDARIAIDSLSLEEHSVTGASSPYYALPQQLETSGLGGEREVVLLGMRDPYWDHRDGIRDLVEDAHWSQPVAGARGDKTLKEVNRLWQRCVVIRGQIAGFWEFDPDSAAVRVGLFSALSDADASGLRAECERTTVLLRDELGHARVYAMEPKNTRAKSLAALAKLPVHWAP